LGIRKGAFFKKPPCVGREAKSRIHPRVVILHTSAADCPYAGVQTREKEGEEKKILEFPQKL
jgi:hypothetical protein